MTTQAITFMNSSNLTAAAPSVETTDSSQVFSKLMNQTQQKVNSQPQTDFSTGETSSSQAYDSYQYQDHQVSQESKTSFESQAADQETKLEELGQEIVSDVADYLSADQEQVTEKMEELGLSAFDLLLPQNLTQLLSAMNPELTGENLLVDSSFTALTDQLEGLSNQLMELFQGQTDELAELVAQMDALTEPGEVPTDLLEQVELQDSSSRISTEMPADLSEKAETVQPIRTEEDKKPSTELKTETANREEENPDVVEEEKTVGPETETQMDENPDSQTDQEEKPQTRTGVENRTQTRGQVNQTSENFTLNANQGQTTEGLESFSEVSGLQGYSDIDALDLLDQVTQQLRVMVADDQQSVEMQLNPENLGKVYLNVSSKEGTVSAQITTQNEEVRQALEAQLADLRQTLNQAGVKVDAVEITVASHEFERNLEQGMGQEMQQNPERQGQAPSTSARRNLSLDDLADPELQLTEEERLAAQIMKDNGNSVDYTA